jgi:hypothetical protein
MIELWKESDPQAGKNTRARTSCLNQLPISSLKGEVKKKISPVAASFLASQPI